MPGVDLIIPTHTGCCVRIAAGDIGIPAAGAHTAIGIGPIDRPTIDWRAGVVGNTHGGDKAVAPIALNQVLTARSETTGRLQGKTGAEQ